MRKLTALLALVILPSLYSTIYGQACASNDSWTWPGHRNWFVAPNAWTGLSRDMQAGTNTVLGAPGSGAGGTGVTAYEGVSSVSDDQGNLLFYTNGRLLYTGTGAGATVTYTGLLTGNEGGATGNNGSASQGIMTLKHPLSNDYYIFTSDDANGGSIHGLNYFVVNAAGTVTSGPNRLGTFFTSEGIAVTRHANGLDLWIGILESGSGEFNAYLLTCTGVDIANSNLNQTGAPTISGQQLRGALAFSWDGTKLAQAHPNQWPTADQQVSIYDFNNATGAITNPMHIAPTNVILSPYDCIFSPDNSRLYVSRQSGGGIDYFDLSSGNAATITASRTATGIPTVFSALEIGPGPTLYTTSGTSGGSIVEVVVGGGGNLNNGTSFSAVNVPGTAGNVSSGLPIMYIPPTDEPDITDVGPFCNTDAPVDLATNWTCAGTDAETVTHTYTGPGITNATTGTFDPSVAGVGTHQIIFTLTGGCAALDDTLMITVNSCACEDTTLQNAINDICVNGSVDLSAYEVTTDPGTWSIVGTPAGSNPATITGSTFNAATNRDAGTYRIRFTLNSAPNASCPDSAERNIVVNPLPIVNLAGGSFCNGDSMQLDAGNAGATSWIWNPGGENQQTKWVTTAGPHKAVVTLPTGCIDSGTVTLTVNPLPNVNITPPSASCDNHATENLSATPAGGTWYVNDVVNGSGTFDPNALGANTHEIKYSYTDGNGCSDSDSVNVVINAAPNVSITPFGPLCTNEDSVTMAANQAGGTWYINGTVDGNGVFDPNRTGAGNHQVAYTYTDGNSCSDSDTVAVVVNAAPSVNITPPSASCDNHATENLSATPAGGTWYINDVVNGSGTFDPNALGANTHEIKYSYTDGNGCSDSDSVNVVINAAPNVSITPFGPLCTNEDSVTMAANQAGGTWYINGTVDGNGVFDPNRTGAGNHQVAYTYTDGNSCSDSDTVAVVVNAAPSVNITPPSASCDNHATENLSATPAGGTWYVNDVVNGSGTFDPNALGANTHEIKYSYTDGSGCSDSDSVNVVINAAPNVVISPLGLLCDNDTVATMNATPAGGNWFINDVASTNIFDPKVVGAGTNHKIKYSYTDGNGCSDSDSVANVVVNVAPTAIINTVDGNLAWCANVMDTLIASPSANVGYLWNYDNLLTNDSLFINAAGTYTLVVDSTNGCKDTTTITIVRDTVDAQLSNVEACDGFVATLDPGVAGASYLWSNGATSQSIQITLGPAEYGNTYGVLVTNANGCMDTASAQIIQKVAFTVSVGADDTICQGQSATFTATTTGTLVNPQYSWYIVPDGNTVVGSSSSYTATTADTFYVNVVDLADNCWDMDSAVLTVNPLPVVSVGPDTAFCSLGKDELAIYMSINGVAGYHQSGSYSWSPISSSVDSVVQTFAPVTVIGSFVDSNGCASSDTVEVSEHCEPLELKLPNVFVPGGTYNPWYTPIGMDDEDYIWYVNNVILSDFVIYNRWGLRVFQSHDLLPKWDGFYENQPVASGTYFYVWKYQDSSLKEYNLTGFIQVFQQNDR